MPFTSLFDSLKALVQDGVDKAVEEVDINVESVGVSNENQLLEAIDTGDTEIFITDSFALTQMIKIPEGVSLYGKSNPRIKIPNDAIAGFWLWGNNTLADFTIHGEHKSRGVLIEKGHNHTVRNVVFEKVGNDKKTGFTALLARNGYGEGKEKYIENLVIDGCTFKDIKNDAMMIWKIKRGRIVNNIVDGTYGDHKHRGNAMRAEDLDNCIVSNNIFNNIGRMGVEALGEGTTGTVISNNVIDGFGKQSKSVTFAISVGQLANNIVITGNVAKNAVNGYGFEIPQDASNIILSNNVTKDLKMALSVSAGCHDLTITNNIFDGGTKDYLVQLFQCWSVVYQGNTHRGHSYRLADGNKRALLVNQCNKVHVSNNVFEGDYNSNADAAVYFYKHLGKDNPKAYGSWDVGGKISANAHTFDNNILRGGGTRLFTLHDVIAAQGSLQNNITIS
tara:strand:- start:185 stop:1528 length:1344 start_codon:yes stop_codon:yes gene_type:complete